MISISGCIISFIFPLKRIIPVKRISIPTFRPEYIIILWINLICLVFMITQKRLDDKDLEGLPGVGLISRELNNLNDQLKEISRLL